MPTYNLYIKEEELKNKVAHDYFPDYDCTQIIGNIDICIAIRVLVVGGGQERQQERHL